MTMTLEDLRYEATNTKVFIIMAGLTLLVLKIKFVLWKSTFFAIKSRNLGINLKQVYLGLKPVLFNGSLLPGKCL